MMIEACKELLPNYILNNLSGQTSSQCNFTGSYSSDVCHPQWHYNHTTWCQYAADMGPHILSANSLDLLLLATEKPVANVNRTTPTNQQPKMLNRCIL